MSCPSRNILHEDTAAKSLRDSGLVSSAILKDEGTSDDLYQGFNYMDRLEDDLVGGSPLPKPMSTRGLANQLCCRLPKYSLRVIE